MWGKLITFSKGTTFHSKEQTGSDLLPVAVDKDITGVFGAAGDWDVIPPIFQAMDSTAPKLYSKYVTLHCARDVALTRSYTAFQNATL